MGLLDGILGMLGNKAKEAIRTEVDKKINEYSYGNNYEYKGDNDYNYDNNTNTNNIGKYYCSGEELLRQRLEQVFKTEYGFLKVERNIPVKKLPVRPNIKTPVFMPKYSYGLSSNGRYIALFSVFYNRNDYSKWGHRAAKQIAEENGIVHFNFFSHMPNEVEYITKRLKDNIMY